MDRISDLHESILRHLVSFLSTKEAIRSSVLSRRWKLVWTLTTKLELNDDYWGKFSDRTVNLNYGIKLLLYSKSNPPSPGEARCMFTQYVNRVLLLRRNNPFPLDKLDLESKLFKPERSQLNSWILQCVQLAVKELVLSIFDSDLRIPLSLPPLCDWIHSKTLVYLKLTGKMCLDGSISFPNLQLLDLSMITYAVVAECVELPKLKRLFLDQVVYKTEDSLNKLLQGCPLLDHVYIQRCRWDNIPNLVISNPILTSLVIENRSAFQVPPEFGACWTAKLDAPQLQSLTLSDSSWIKSSFSIQTSPPLLLNSLTKATFRFSGELHAHYRNAVFKLIETLPASNLEHLLLLQETMMLLYSESEYNVTTGPMFRNLTKLDLRLHICFTSPALIVIKNLIEHVDNLQHLLLAGSFKSCGTLSNESPWKDLEPPPKEGVLPRLRQVKATHINGCTHEFKLLGYILGNADNLELMTLNVSTMQNTNGLELLQTISMFPRRSPICQFKLTTNAY